MKVGKIMTTIGIRAAKMLGVKPQELVKALNTRTRPAMEGFGELMKTNGALTQLGQDVYQAEKKAFGAKNLTDYLKALVEEFKDPNLTFIEPFNTWLKKIAK
jgi:predicted transcriptional regulator with HTH domain